MPREFNVLVLNTPPNGVYSAGSVVSGALVVEVDEPKGYNAIQVALVGRAHVSWSEGSSRSTGSGSFAEEEYVNVEAVLWSKEQAIDHKLPTGRHSFQFQFQPLPQGIPPSFMGPGRIGYVQYYVEGRIATGFLRHDEIARQEITVTQVVDINVSRLLTRVDVENEGTVCCLWCTSAPITMTVHLPRTGFCIGEGIPVRVTLNNRSSRPITLQAELIASAIYQAQGRRNISRNILCGIQSTTPMVPRAVTVWDPRADLLKVPPVTTSMSTPNGIIHVFYLLRVTAVLPWSANIVVDAQLTIGNVPLRQHVEATPSEQTALPSAPPQPLQPSTGWGVHDTPPPYAAAIKM